MKRFSYSCYELTPESVEILKEWLKVHNKNLKENLFLHHCTIELGKKTLDNYIVGTYSEINVIGYSEDENGSAFLVDTCLSTRQNPHITISTSEGIKPSYSNTLLKKSYIEYFEAIPLVTRINEYFY